MAQYAKKIWWINQQGDSCIESSPECRLEFVVHNHGDHETVWVLEQIDGKEVARHNVAHISSIEWETLT